MSSPGPLYPWLILNAAAAAWITFTGIHAGHNADSLLFSLASVYCWTPFFWKQDRIGMLTPLLASGVSDPVANIVLQVGVTSFAGLCVPLLMVEVLKPSRGGRVAATLANAVMLLLAPERVVSNVLYECNYPQAMVLGCSALLVLGTSWRWWRVIASAFFMSLACWIYLGVLPWLLTLIVVRGWLRPDVPRKRTLLELALSSVGLGVGVCLMILVRLMHPDYIARVITTFIPPDRWVNSWLGFAYKLDSLPGFWTWVATLAAVGAVGTIVRLIRPSPTDLRGPLALALLIPGLVEFAFLGTQYWPTINEYQPRYVLGTLIGTSTVLVWMAIIPLEARLRGRWVIAACGLALVAAATARFGWPRPDRPRADLHTMADVDDLPTDEIDAVGGNYWTAWPTVFDANARRYASGRTDMLYGVIERSNVLRPMWEKTHPNGMRVAIRNTPLDREKLFFEADEEKLTPPVKVADCGRYEIYFTRPNR